MHKKSHPLVESIHSFPTMVTHGHRSPPFQNPIFRSSIHHPPGQLSELNDIPDPEYVMDMQIDPTRCHIAFSAIYNLHELWVMENLLPEDVGK
jgi:hypothetical protein